MTYELEGVLAVSDADKGPYRLCSKDLKRIALKNSRVPLVLDHEPSLVLGYGTVAFEPPALIFKGYLDCAYFLDVLEKTKDLYYRLSKPYKGGISEETMTEYLSIQFGQLSLAHNTATDRIDHVGLVHLGQRVGSQANFAVAERHPRVYRAENSRIVDKMLASAFNQRHQAHFRTAKLLKDIPWNENVQRLIHASFKPPPTMDPRDQVIAYLLQQVKGEEESSPPKKLKREEEEEDGSLEARLDRIEQFFQIATKPEQAAPEEEEEEAAKRTRGIPPTADEETRARLNLLEAQINAMIKPASRSSAATTIARKPSTAVAKAAMTAHQKIAKSSNLIEAAFDPRDSASEIETVFMTRLMPRNNPLAVRLIKGVQQEIQEMPIEDRKTFYSLIKEEL